MKTSITPPSRIASFGSLLLFSTIALAGTHLQADEASFHKTLKTEEAALPMQTIIASSTGNASENDIKMPSEVKVFLDRVFQQIPDASHPPQKTLFKSWDVEGKVTEEGIGLMPIAGIDPEKLIARVMDVDHYVGNIDYVKECRSIPDKRFSPPHSVRFYQYLSLPVISDVHHQLVLVDGGERKGYRYAYWYLLKEETKGLDSKKAARSAFSVGAWLVSPKAVGYALSSWPMREDVGYLNWAAMTTGANIAAKSTIEGNIKGMSQWAKK